MLDFSKSLSRLLNHEHPSAEFGLKRLPVTQLVPKWLAEREVAAGDSYRGQAFAAMYQCTHGLRKNTFLNMNIVHESLGIDRLKLFETMSGEEPQHENLLNKSKGYKRKAKNFCKLVLNRTKFIDPRPANFGLPLEFLPVPSVTEDRPSSSQEPHNITVNVACSSFTSHTGCDHEVKAPSPPAVPEIGNHGQATSALETPAHSLDGRHGQSYLTVNITAPPSLCGSSAPSTPVTSCASCPPTPATAHFSTAQTRIPIFSGMISNFEEDTLDQTSAWSELSTASSPSVPSIPSNQSLKQDHSEHTVNLLLPGATTEDQQGLGWLGQTEATALEGNALGLTEPDVPASLHTPSSLAFTAALDLRPIITAESPGEQQHRDSLIAWILRSAEISENHQYMLNTLPTDDLQSVMTAFYDNGTTEGMSLLEFYWQEFLHEYRNDFSAPLENVDSQSLSTFEDRPITHTPVYTDGEPLRESHRAISSTRTRIMDSAYTMIFNHNNSPIPRHALAARPSPLSDSIKLISSHLSNVQAEMVRPMLQETDINEIVRMADIFRNEGTEPGLNYLKDRWNTWIRDQTSRCSVEQEHRQSQNSLSGEFIPVLGPLTTSPLSLEIVALAQEADTIEIYPSCGSDQQSADVQPAITDYEHAMSLLGQEKWEDIARWAVSTGPPDSARVISDDSVDRNSSSVFLDHLERGVELGQDAQSDTLSMATAGYKLPTIIAWSLPGIQGGLLPRHLSTQTRIWGL